MNQRIFIALGIPEKIRLELLNLSSSIQGARWLQAEQIHLTLRFIGEVDGSMFQSIRESLESLRFHSFQLKIQGVGHFPPRGEPRVLFAAVRPDEYLFALKEKIDQNLRSCGIPLEGRKFHPHLTLARLKSPPEKQVGIWLQNHVLFELPPFPIKEFELLTSKLTSSGAIYHSENLYTASYEA